MICLLVATLWQAASPPLTLANAWQAALDHRSVSRIVNADIAGATAGVRVAGQVPNPTMSASYTGSVPRGHVLVDQPLSWLLTRGADRDAARAALAGSRADSAIQMAQFAGEVRRSFFGAVAAEARSRLLGEQQAVADSLVRIAHVRYAAGDISRFEAQQVELESRVQSQAVLVALEELAVSRALLASLIGRSTADLLVLDGSLGAGLAERDSLPSDDELPVIIAALQDSVAAERTAASAARARIPFPSIEAGTEWSDPSEAHATAVIGIAVPVPLWNRGGAQVAQARARAGQAAARTAEARRTARQQLEAARIRLRSAAARAEFARDSLVPDGRSLRDRALAAYRAGETGVVPVLEAIRRERELELSAIDAMLAYQGAVASLHELIGVVP
ncbi:MAG: TolC family protein [Gemmatimonadota bacterium]